MRKRNDACPYPLGMDLPDKNRLAAMFNLSMKPTYTFKVKTVIASVSILLIAAMGVSYWGWINQLNSGFPLEPRLITDKEIYHVGEKIHATLLYYNPNFHSVSFNPPKKVYAYAHSWPDTIPNSQKSPEESPSTIELDWRIQGVPWVVVGAESFYTVVECEFMAFRVGFEMIHLGDLTKQVQIVE